MTELRWITSAATSALAAAAAVLRGQPAADARLAEALAAAARNLVKALQSAGIRPEAFFAHAVPLSAGVPSNRELAGFALRRAAGTRPTQELVSAIAAAIEEIEKVCRLALPKGDEELRLRSGPLREQWEARGPGMLRAIGRIAGIGRLVDRADVFLAHAISGGGGQAYLPYSAVSIEAVLANPHEELPEVARLGWLISTLHFGAPEFHEAAAPERMAALAGLAMLPAALAAAEHVELVRSTPELPVRAVAAWTGVGPDAAGRGDEVAAILATWWNTEQDMHPTWAVALRALNQMLAAEGL